MAALGYEFTCTRCNFLEIYRADNVAYRYRVPGRGETWVPFEPGWCRNCQTVRRILSALDPEEIEARRQKHRERVAAAAPPESLVVRWLHRAFPKETKRDVMEEHFDQLLHMLSGHRTLRRCIECGSLSVSPLDFPENPRLRMHSLGMEHPGCPGQLQVSAADRHIYGLIHDVVIDPVFET